MVSGFPFCLFCKISLPIIQHPCLFLFLQEKKNKNKNPVLEDRYTRMFVQALFSVGAKSRKKVSCPSRIHGIASILWNGMWLLKPTVGVSDFLAQNNAGGLSSEVSTQFLFCKRTSQKFLVWSTFILKRKIHDFCPTIKSSFLLISLATVLNSSNKLKWAGTIIYVTYIKLCLPLISF